MHGNELIGPTTLLYLFPLLHPQNTRILYFPICNPSGYDKKQRETYPNEISLNRDYPIDKNTDCYRGSSTRIID
jgi:predicted deacylase